MRQPADSRPQTLGARAAKVLAQPRQRLVVFVKELDDVSGEPYGAGSVALLQRQQLRLGLVCLTDLFPTDGRQQAQRRLERRPALGRVDQTVEAGGGLTLAPLVQVVVAQQKQRVIARTQAVTGN